MVERINYKQIKSVLGKVATMPVASAGLVGEMVLYSGVSGQYEHGYVYECVETVVDTITFTPNTVSCSWSDLSAFLQGETQDYDDVVSGTMTYMTIADLWVLVAKDENDNTVLTYQQYTEDWENLGFTFTGTFADGDVISFVRTTTATYGWERIDIQPNTAVWGGITGIITNQTDLVSYIATRIGTVQTQVDIINSKIPSQASAANKLADKNFVNSSIATSTATFRGTYNTLAELEAQQADDNDYGFVIGTDAAGNTVYNRYKYNGTAWVFEYALNNSSFTANQWSAINSGITSADVALIATALQSGDNVSELYNDAGYLTSHQSLADLGITATAAEINTLDGIIATTAELNYVSGVSSSIQTQLNSKQATISDLGTIRTNASNGASAYTIIQGYGNIVSHNASEFATSAQGALADTALQSGDNISELVNDAGYLTSLALSGLTDANISSPAQGQILMWNGTQWINSTSTSSIAWGGITGTLSNQSDLSNALNAKQDASTAVIHAANTQVGDTSTPVYIAADGTATACATDFDMGSITGVLDNWFDMGTIN